MAFAATLLLVGSPVLAQCPRMWQQQQKPVNVVQKREAMLNREVQNAYKRGMIDSFELAQIQRDLDGARAEDEYYRIESSTRRIEPIMKKLDQIQSFLEAHEADNANVAQVRFFVQ